MLGPLSMGCRQGELTARPYNAADAVLFLKTRDRLKPRAGLRGIKALAANRPQHTNLEY